MAEVEPLPKLVQLWQLLTKHSNQKFIAADIDHGSLYNTRALFQTAVLIIRAIRKRESFAMDGREEKIMATKVRFTLPLLAAFVFADLTQHWGPQNIKLPKSQEVLSEKLYET